MTDAGISSEKTLPEETAKPLLKLASTTPVLEVIRQMSQAASSFALVMDGDDRLVGIFTERDLVRSVAMDEALEQMQIAQVMSPAVITINASQAGDAIAVLDYFQRYEIRHLPVVDAAGQVQSVLTAKEVRSMLGPNDMLRLRQVEEVMNRQVIHVPPTLKLDRVAQVMSVHRVSCVVVVSAESLEQEVSTQSPRALIPIGILTERDIVRMFALAVDFGTTAAETVMSAPLMPITRQTTLWDAHLQMQQYRVRRLVVVGSQGELVGLVTQTSILRSLDPLELVRQMDVMQGAIDRSTQQLQAEVTARQQQSAELQLLHKKLQIANQELSALAYLDGLTQVANRRQFDRSLAQEWQRLRREKSSMALVLCDVDHFKAFNDFYGHGAGDDCLRQVARVLTEGLQRSSDEVARYGGEEFAILLPNTEMVGAVRLVERIQQDMIRAGLNHGKGGASELVTLSFGIASCVPSFAMSFADLLTAADRAMYHSKEQGRNTYRCAVENEATSKPKFRIIDPE
jgi:diguanylate cyclase (GGDEF)-like protein